MKNILISMVIAGTMFATSAQSQELHYDLGGFSPGGIGSIIGAGIDQAVRDEYPGSTITYQPTGGGYANVALLDAGKIELGLAHAGEILPALEGAEPYKKKIDSMRALGVMYAWLPLHVAVNKDFAEKHGLKNFSDIVKNKAPIRIAVNPRGNSLEKLVREMLAASGATYEDLESWGGQVVFAASKDAVPLISDRRVDAYITGLFVGGSRILQVSKSQDLVLLPISEEIAGKAAAKAGAIPYTIPATGYDFIDKDVPSLSVVLLLVANENFPADKAYTVTKAIGDHIERLKAVTSAMSALDLEALAGNCVVPYHTGAVRYFEEKGLQVPSKSCN